jgi:hypothetical protein
MSHLGIALLWLPSSGGLCCIPAPWPPLVRRPAEWERVEPQGTPLLCLPSLQAENVQQLVCGHAPLLGAGLDVRIARTTALGQSAIYASYSVVDTKLFLIFFGSGFGSHFWIRIRIRILFD